MESDILAKILQAEREIQTKIDSARKTGEERFHTLKEQLEKRIEQEESLAREQCRRSLEEADALARRKAAAFLDTETRRAGRLSSLADEALKKVVMKHIVRILPDVKT